MVPYVVRAGDHLERLAFQGGFDASAVWNDELNAALRERRPNPQMLAPGDILFVPEAASGPGVAVSPGGTYCFTARVPTVHVRIAFRSEGRAYANEPYRLTGNMPPLEGTTDGEGLFEAELPVHIAEVNLTFPALHLSHVLRIGHLDPVEVDTGVEARLRHLGYMLPLREWLGHAPTECEASLRLSLAVRAFQFDHGLSVTGTLDPATRSALVGAHGT